MKPIIKTNTKWENPENIELAAASLATGLARLLRPDVFKNSADIVAVLSIARDGEPEPVSTAAIESEIRNLRARINELTARVNQQETV